MRLATDFKTIDYQITWEPPLAPNGLVYFYIVHLDQESQNGPKDERCLGYDIHSVQVSLLPRTTYRLKILTYTIARLNREYDDQLRSLPDDGYPTNATHAYSELIFTTVDLPGSEIFRR